MKVLIDINHPAHVHLFKNVAAKLNAAGHQVLFTTRRKEISHILLENLNLRHICMGKHYKSKFGKLFGILRYDIRLVIIALKFRPTIFLSMGSIYATHAAFFLRKPSIMLQDTENASLQHALTFPFSSVILNPVCFNYRKNAKQIFYNGYHELAYLHPNYFSPREEILKEVGLSKEDRIIIMRFVSWNANHDTGHTGISDKNKVKAVKEFSKYGKVLITSEANLPDEIKEYAVKLAPEKIHDVMAYSSLLYGESATMASECAVMGVPSIYLDNEGRGYTDEEQEKYDLVFNYSESPEDQAKSIEKGSEILKDFKPDYWKKNHDKLMSEKINVTDFLYWFIESYPQSRKTMNENKDYDLKFVN